MRILPALALIEPPGTVFAGYRPPPTERERGMGVRRRMRLFVLVAATAGLVVGVAPVGAATPVVRSAAAYIEVGDDMGTAISVQGDVLRDGTVVGRSAFLLVTQTFCDEAADQLVFRSFFALEPLRHSELVLRPRLAGGQLEARLTFDVTEDRHDGCDATPTGPGTLVVLEPARAFVRVGWRGQGPTLPTGEDTVSRDARAQGRLSIEGHVRTGQFRADAASLSRTRLAG